MTKKTKKLSLDRTTLRALDRTDLQAVQAGVAALPSQGPTVTATCFIMKDTIIIRTSG